ncbi:MAG: FAD-dependent oxidoreductase [bacterium]
MKRDLTLLRDKQFDVLIIGGGIYGVCTAWDAALRGLSVALIDKNDFGSATSSNSLKIIHGGLRYLQHADFKRMRESIQERRVLMHIAPHLVHPLTCVMPTYGHALKGKEVMSVALRINDIVGFDRNKSADPNKFMPNGKVLSKSDCLDLIPGVDEAGLTGAALWYDCQVYNSERLLISILHSAVEAGATVANYVEMTGFTTDADAVTGVTIKDGLSGDTFDICARVVVNNSGPWVNDVLAHLNGRQISSGTRLSYAMNLVVKKQVFPKYAVGVWSKTQFKDNDAVLSKGSRLYFITPWRDYTVIGTTHDHYEGKASDFDVSEEAVVAFIEELNHTLPSLDIKREDVTLIYRGILPIEENHPGAGDIKLLKQYQIVDHHSRDGLDGLITVIGVKYTTARDVARHAVDHVLRKLKRQPVESQTNQTPVYGGRIERFDDFLKQEKRKKLNKLNDQDIERLIHNYGSEYHKIIELGDEKPDWLENVSNSRVFKAEIVNAVRNEMAVKLSDVVRRRTELGSAEYPGDDAVKECASVMADELCWPEGRVRDEIKETKDIYFS